MNILPEQYSNLDLSRSEKLLVTYTKTKFDGFGYLLLKVNPACIETADLDSLITSEGLLFFKFFDSLDKADMFEIFITAYHAVYNDIIDTILGRLLGNKSICEDNKMLLFPVNVLCVFPAILRNDILLGSYSNNLQNFITDHCIFSNEFKSLRSDFAHNVADMLLHSNIAVSKNRLIINDKNINSILQRIAPEYVTLRVGGIFNLETKSGVDEELLIVTEDDRTVKAFMLDKDQINIINGIKKGEQLILACAGSGKSVLLLSKCFKAASMNPDKKFLITCYNRNLQSQYAWLIDKAGFREKNVECLTFHKLCKKLLERNKLYLPQIVNENVEAYFVAALNAMNDQKIQDRYYGIFIDEVQIFNPEWYKFCYNLLEHKSSDDHFFVICGDRTQDIKKRQKRGKAPWNAGEGYPNYRGGNKNIRIEKNYRNCIQINEYINRYVKLAKGLLNTIDKDMEIDPDLFLRGQAVRNGYDVVVDNITDRSNKGEAAAIIRAITNINNKHQIPYDEIAVVIYNKSYNGPLSRWPNRFYNIIDPLCRGLEDNNIPYAKMYSEKEAFAARYGVDSGVVITSVDGALGLDFRAVIVCGLKPLGVHDGTNRIDWFLEIGVTISEDKIASFKKDISLLYIACTRAKEVLNIITTDNIDKCVYVKLLNEALQNEEEIR